MMILLNCSLAAAGVAGMAWYKSSSSQFWPFLVYFVTLCTVGSVSALASCVRVRRRALLLFAAGLNALSVCLLILLVMAAVMVSLGSGFAVFPFVVYPLAINLASLHWFRTEVKA